MKKILLLAAICLTTISTFAQTFRHGVGLGYSVDKVKYSDARIGAFFTYVPRIDFLEREKTSLSVAFPFSVGGSGNYAYSSNYGTVASSFSFHMNIPAMLNFNMGAGSSRQNRSRFGGFVGGGFGLNYSASTEMEYFDEEGNRQFSDIESSTFGPAANGGFRIGFGEKGKNIEIKLSYFHGLNSDQLRLFMMGCLFNF